MKKVTKKLICAYTGLPSKVTFEYDIENIRNGTKTVVPHAVKCDYRDIVAKKISEEGFFCNCEREIKKLIEDDINQ